MASIKILNGTLSVLDESFGAKRITNIDTRYALTDHVSVQLGGDNVFNVYPDKHRLLIARFRGIQICFKRWRAQSHHHLRAIPVR